MNYYSLKNIEKENGDYNVIYGERSNGKTFAVLERIVKRYFYNNGEQGAYIRRFDIDFKGKRGAVLFDGLTASGIIEKYSGGEWDRVYYYSGRWFFARMDTKEEKIVKAPEPFCFAFALGGMEHDKSTSYPRITTVVFDEFLTRSGELLDEFNLFLNVVSTIIRQRDNVKIFLLGNTVNKESTYFHNMGIYDIVKGLKKGEIKTVTTKKGLRISVEYAESPGKEKPSDKFYDFKASTARMIIAGDWEIQSYPHAPAKHTKKDIYFTYYIVYNDYILACDMINSAGNLYTFVHRKKGEIKHPERDYIFSNLYDPRVNWHRRIDYNYDRMSSIIYRDLKSGNVFFTDDETGEVLRNYLLYSLQTKENVI